MQGTNDPKETVYDVITAGFGPAGIALAAALEDAVEQGALPMNALFIERASSSEWQPEMLLMGTHIQHHWLRDFATPRNPRSRFTFSNYLHTHGRLFAFGQLDGHPARIEWSDYVKWVAGQLRHYACYGHEIVDVTPIRAHSDGPVTLLAVHARARDDGREQVWYARNLVLATGRSPSIPSVFAPLMGPRMVHPSQFTTAIRQIRPQECPTFAVIGSGENAIEIVLTLAENFPQSTILSIHRGNGFRLYELGHFTNESFFPEEVDYVYGLAKAERARLFEAEVRRTNYSAVGADMSAKLYRRVYEERVQGHNRIQLIKRSAVTTARACGTGYELQLEDVYCRRTRLVNADMVFVCTGYREERIPALLDDLRPYLRLDSQDDLVVSRDYQVQTTSDFQPGIFLCGLTERTHGISDATSFGMMALKGQRILEALQARAGGA